MWESQIGVLLIVIRKVVLLDGLRSGCKNSRWVIHLALHGCNGTFDIRFNNSFKPKGDGWLFSSFITSWIWKLFWNLDCTTIIEVFWAHGRYNACQSSMMSFGSICRDSNGINLIADLERSKRIWVRWGWKIMENFVTMRINCTDISSAPSVWGDEMFNSD